MTTQLIDDAPRAQYSAIESDPSCGPRRPNPKGFRCAPPATLPLALRPAPIISDLDHSLEGQSPTSLSPIR